MAGSRLERIGTIYTRAAGLIKSKGIAWEDRPLWYDIYEAFPPKEEPRYDRPAPNMSLKNIFYEEDKIRAKFHAKNKPGALNLSNNKHTSITQQFIDVYHQLEKQYDGNASEEKIYGEAIEMLKRERLKRFESAEEGEAISLSESFQKAQAESEKPKDPPVNIKIKDILKD